MAEPDFIEPVVQDEDGHLDPCEHIEWPPDDLGVMAEATRPWRPAESLLALKQQINAAFPGR